jgi:response regulator RpfG family c-di-GMP phosphodiesterase
MRKSILIIEDSKALSFVLATVFKSDFDVFTARNYADAFFHLRSKDMADLVIMNIPDDESENCMFLAHLSSSSLFYDIPVVVLSDSKDSRLRDKTKALGASLFLNTPFDPVSLSEKVKELIVKKESRQFIKVAQ